MTVEELIEALGAVDPTLVVGIETYGVGVDGSQFHELVAFSVRGARRVVLWGETVVKPTDRIGTHSVGCADWGPRHYECLRAERDSLKARLLRGGANND